MFTLRIPQSLERSIRLDLSRRHPFAGERVGFVFTRQARCEQDGVVVLAESYEPVADADYIDDPSVGARIGSNAIRKAMQRLLDTGGGVFHVHQHHFGPPRPSSVDQNEIGPLMRSIGNASPTFSHGMLILSDDAAYAETSSQENGEIASKITFVGSPLRITAGTSLEIEEAMDFSRQSFLGPHAQDRISACHVGIVGLGGGGSHIAQQLAHVGFCRFTVFDPDIVELSNLNRLIGATREDATIGVPKVEVAVRGITALNPDAAIRAVHGRWQDRPEALRECDIVFGCVDGYAERRDLETAARRHLIPYLDIGLDVNSHAPEPPRMAGQVILSLPGDKCMSCLGFLTDAKIAREAERYGAAGPRPQVVWANGILASTAVGVAIDLLTDWTQSIRGPVYLSYDSNNGTIEPHKRLLYLPPGPCPHFPLSDVGSPVFRSL